MFTLELFEISVVRSYVLLIWTEFRTREGTKMTIFITNTHYYKQHDKIKFKNDTINKIQIVHGHSNLYTEII